MSDAGLAAERTALARRRTTLPFLVVALLGSRVALDAPLPGLVLALVACAGAVAAMRLSPARLTGLVLVLAGAAALLPPAAT